MKLERKSTPATTGGITASPTRFKMGSSPLSFKIMSDGIYNDKILACIRELSCNAADAHIAAGKNDVPFAVHIPTALDPIFTVTDAGTGMSHGDVKNLYCGYFNSSRNRSNEYTGAMGLGSKSPFSYTEGFTVISKFVRQNKFRTVENGRARRLAVTYSMMMVPVKPEGCYPQVLRVHTREMTPDETVGLEVSFPVRDRDIQEFENKARVALEFFNPMPVLNIEKFQIPQQNYVMQGTGWALRKNEHTHQTSRVRAIQGKVGYNAGAIDPSRMTAAQKIVADMAIDLFFEIGELSVTASRETLSNEEETIEAVLAKLANIHDEVLGTTKKQMNSYTNEWDAKLYLWNLENSTCGKVIKAALGRGDFAGSYGAYEIRKTKPSICELDYRVIQIQHFWRNYGKWATKSRVFKKHTVKDRETLILTPGVLKTEHTKVFDVDGDYFKTEFFYADGKRGAEKFLHRYVQDTDHGAKGAVYLFSKLDKNVSDTEFMREIEHALAKLGKPPLRKISELAEKYPDVEDASEREKYERRKIVFFDCTTSNAWMRCWRKATEDEVIKPGKKYFVAVEKLKPFYIDKDGKKKFHFHSTMQMDRICDKAFEAGLLKGAATQNRVYGLKKNSKFMTHPDWVELTDHIRKEHAKLVANPIVGKAMSLIDAYFNFRLENVCAQAAKKGLLSESAPIMRFYREWLVLKRAEKNVRVKAIKTLCEYTGAKVKGAVNFQDRWLKIVKDYPMIAIHNSGYSGSSEVETVLEYIQQIDAVNAVPLAVAVAAPIEVQEVANAVS